MPTVFLSRKLLRRNERLRRFCPQGSEQKQLWLSVHSPARHSERMPESKHFCKSEDSGTKPAMTDWGREHFTGTKTAVFSFLRAQEAYGVVYFSCVHAAESRMACETRHKNTA
jgi:hypothetical protein